MRKKRRVVWVYDGPRRLCKDEMMLDKDLEVRLTQGDDGSYVTDLDVQTMKRSEAFHNATEEEKGPWMAEDISLEELMS